MKRPGDGAKARRRAVEDGEKRTAGGCGDGVSNIVMSYPSDQ